jgi:hypothetical protein
MSSGVIGSMLSGTETVTPSGSLFFTHFVGAKAVSKKRDRNAMVFIIRSNVNDPVYY